MFQEHSNHDFDLIIVGGGINGAAIARDAALRGLSVLLLEKEDFGSGASSKTSKLAHGGIRYLEQAQFGLIKESLQERDILLKNAPHLVKPLPFVLPVYRNSPYPLWLINLGLYFYDFLAGKSILSRHKKISCDQLQKAFSGINIDRLNGACQYFDAQMKDSRLVIENVKAAEEAGAKVFNYKKVMKLNIIDGQVRGVFVRDVFTDEEQLYGAKVVVFSTGAWLSEFSKDKLKVRICPSKGVHIIIPQIAAEAALLLRAPQDGRVFFVIPWEGNSLVGTTDTYFEESPDKIKVEPEDRSYLLEALRYYFPTKKIDQSSIISEFVGLRPLAVQNGKKISWEMSRDHIISTSQEGVITVSGGKFTTHRKVAEEVVNQVIKNLSIERHFKPCSTKTESLPGANGKYSLNEVACILKKEKLPAEYRDHLLNNYGTASLDIVEIMKQDESACRPICDCHLHTYAEIDYAIQKEYSKTLEDWMMRRTTIAYSACKGLKCVQQTAERFAKQLGWSQEKVQKVVSDCFTIET